MRSGFRVKLGPFWLGHTFRPSVARPPSARSNRIAALTLLGIGVLLASAYLVGR